MIFTFIIYTFSHSYVYYFIVIKLLENIQIILIELKLVIKNNFKFHQYNEKFSAEFKTYIKINVMQKILSMIICYDICLSFNFN